MQFLANLCKCKLASARSVHFLAHENAKLRYYAVSPHPSNVHLFIIKIFEYITVNYAANVINSWFSTGGGSRNFRMGDESHVGTKV